MNKTGLAVRIIRQAKNLTGSQLAKSAKISSALLSQIETGKKDPSLQVLERLASALDVPAEALILMRQGPSSTLVSKDLEVQMLTGAVANLISAEANLRNRLNRDEPAEN